MFKALYYLLFVSYACALEQTKFRELPKALITVPVADVVRKPLADLDHYPTVLDAYKALDYKETDEADMYTRAYQVLFNEVVGIVEHTEDEVLIQIPYLFYQKDKGALPQSAYWIHRSSLVMFDVLQENQIDLETLPPPIDLEEDMDRRNEGIVTLALPFYDAVTQLTYSVGTRFVCTGYDEQHKSFLVYRLKAAAMEVQRLAIPANLCLVHNQKTQDERITDFVTLLRAWTALPGVIPYVWGGSSFTHLIDYDQWNRPHEVPGPAPYTGFDCSCLIVRAAQMCGIPYFLGNSQTIASLLQPITDSAAVQDGDIIWFPGHVMLVDDKAAHTVIEARGYGAGWGRLLEAPLSSIFAGVNTYQELLEKITQNEPLHLLHHDGSFRSTLADVRIYSLRDAWGERSKQPDPFTNRNNPAILR